MVVIMLMAEVPQVCNLYVEHPGLVSLIPKATIVVSPAPSVPLILDSWRAVSSLALDGNSGAPCGSAGQLREEKVLWSL